MASHFINDQLMIGSTLARCGKKFRLKVDASPDSDYSAIEILIGNLTGASTSMNHCLSFS